ncbi:ABC transporter ATP-binding protein [Shinella sp.]|uniref:ABC transporter ATP-binding protein n=1 Tax=Shinella sp. TaxID=1870904 RepID=UPI003F7128FF
MYELKSVHKRYGLAKVALRKIDLTVRDREFLVIYGPAGAGKSTLLNILAGITKPTSGDVLRNGVSILRVPPEKRDAAMAFENYALYSHLSVGENLAFPLKARGIGRAEVEERVKRISGILGIGHLLDRRPGFLSGGQRQRVALGRAIIRPADIYLLDEPVGHLDAKLRHKIRAELKALAEDLSATVVFTTTSSREALALGDRVAVLNAGKLEQLGKPADLYHRPANAFVASFVGDPPMSFISVQPRRHDGRVDFVTADGMPVASLAAEAVSDLNEEVGSKIQVGFRSNEVRIAREGDSNALRGRVDVIENLGYMKIALVGIGNDQVSVSVPAGTSLGLGETVAIAFPRDAVHLFQNARAVTHATPSAGV